MTALLYAADTLRLCDGDAFAAALASVSEERRERALRLHFDRDKRLCVAAELLLRRALRDFGYTSEPVTVRGEYGKPYLRDSHGVFFNLSHSGDHVLCAVADAECGCDIEQLRPAELRVAKRFFHPSEYALLSSKATAEGQNELFFRLWTLKESYVKASGRGLSMPFDSLALCPGADGVSVSISADGVPRSLFEYGDIDSFRCALCIEGADVRAPELVTVPI